MFRSAGASVSTWPRLRSQHTSRDPDPVPNSPARPVPSTRNVKLAQFERLNPTGLLSGPHRSPLAASSTLTSPPWKFARYLRVGLNARLPLKPSAAYTARQSGRFQRTSLPVEEAV